MLQTSGTGRIYQDLGLTVIEMALTWTLIGNVMFITTADTAPPGFSSIMCSIDLDGAPAVTANTPVYTQIICYATNTMYLGHVTVNMSNGTNKVTGTFSANAFDIVTNQAALSGDFYQALNRTNFNFKYPLA